MSYADTEALESVDSITITGYYFMVKLVRERQNCLRYSDVIDRRF